MLSPGWELSAGARREAAIALETSLKLLDVRGFELHAADLMMLDQRMRQRLRADGFESALVADYAPEIDYCAIEPSYDRIPEQLRQMADSAWQSGQHVRPVE